MCTNFVIICLVGVVFFTNIQHAFTAPTTRQEVQSKLFCTSKWQTLKLNWNLKVTDLSTNQNFNSFWNQNENDFKSQTVKRLLLTVIYPRNFTKTFSCYGTVASYVEAHNTTWQRNVSFNIQLPNVGTELLGVKYVSFLKEQARLKFYIRPRINITDVSYRLYYCLRPKQYLPPNVLPFQRNYTCPRHRTVKLSCSHRENDIYEIPNSDGVVCEAMTKEYAQTYSNYDFYIRSETRDGSYSVSSDFRISTCTSRCDKEGFFTVLLIGQTPSYLATITTEQRVVLKWENTGRRSTYLITYTCSNGFNSNQTKKDVTTLTIYNKSFAPYSLCKFCVASQLYEGSLFSEPRCNTTRFPERPPSEPPTITCDSDTCPTTAYHEKRTVTIECMLPKPNTTNGVLNQLVLKYWNDTSHSGAFEEFITTNLTVCEVTLTNLSKKHAYFAQMSVCNSKGCSSLSDKVLIAKAVLTNLKKARRSVLSKIWPGLLSIPTLLVVITIVITLSVKRNRRLTRTEQETSLPEVEEPHNYEHLETNVGQHLNQYDELSNKDDNRNVVDNSC